MTEISIIVPVYNVESYLKRCMESILAQSFQNFEVVLVDDGSTDTSGMICDEYAERNANVRVVHKANGGVAAARNTGIEESRGTYITFIDSDDYVERHYLEVLYRSIRNQNADLAICDGEIVMEGRGEREERKACDWEGEIGDAEVISKAEAYKRMLLAEHMCITAWEKLYHRNLFQGVRYPEGEICEDTYVLDQIVENSNRIVCTRYKGYFYVIRGGSLMHGEMKPMHMTALRNAKHLWDFMAENYPEAEDAAKKFYYNNCFQVINLMVMDPEKKYRAECRRLRKEILREGRFFAFHRTIGWTEKAAWICLLFGLPWYRWVWGMYLKIIRGERK